jgi:hypothetical protein
MWSRLLLVWRRFMRDPPQVTPYAPDVVACRDAIVGANADLKQNAADRLEHALWRPVRLVAAVGTLPGAD